MPRVGAVDLVAKGDRERLTAFLRKAPRTVREGLRKAPRAVRGDLWTVARDPLPSVGLLGWLPHVHVMLFVAIMGLLNANQSRQVLGEASALWTLIVVLQPAAALLALSRPVPAWWLSTIGLSATAAAAETGADRDTLWPWSVAGIALHTLVLLLLALRVRPRVAVEALGLTVLAGLLNTSLASQNHNQVLTRGAVIFATAVVVGTALRGRRVARTRLVRQEELTAEERSRRTLLEERNRIARELHDVVAHHMSVISIQAQVAPHLVDAPTAELTENLAGIRESAVEALTELRRVLGVLRSEDAGAEGYGTLRSPPSTGWTRWSPRCAAPGSRSPRRPPARRARSRRASNCRRSASSRRRSATCCGTRPGRRCGWRSDTGRTVSSCGSPTPRRGSPYRSRRTPVTGCWACANAPPCSAANWPPAAPPTAAGK